MSWLLSTFLLKLVSSSILDVIEKHVFFKAVQDVRFFYKNKATSRLRSAIFNTSIWAYSPSAVDQPFRCSELKSKEGSALSSGVEAITLDPAVGPQSLRFCKGDTVCLLCCVGVEMWEVDLCLKLSWVSVSSLSLFIFHKKKKGEEHPLMLAFPRFSPSRSSVFNHANNCM